MEEKGSDELERCEGGRRIKTYLRGLRNCGLLVSVGKEVMRQMGDLKKGEDVSCCGVVEWCGVLWCGVVECGVVCCGVMVWCDVVCGEV